LITRRLEKAYQLKRAPSALAAWEDQFDAQRSQLQGKYSKNWSNTNSSVRLQDRVVKVTATAEARATVTSSCLTADDFGYYFNDKIDRIRASTAASPSPVITDRLIAEPLSHLRRTSAAEVTAILKKSSARQCQLDPRPN